MKKLISILLVGLMLCAQVVAFAVPSKTTTDITKAVTITTSTGVTVADDFALGTTSDSPAVVEEISKLFAFVNNPDATEPVAPVTYFDTEVQDQITAAFDELIAAALPAGETAAEIDINNLEINEFTSLEVANYDAEYGDMAVEFSFATDYKVGQNMLALLGAYTTETAADGTTTAVPTWIVVPAKVVEDTDNLGDDDETMQSIVEVDFTADVMAQLSEADEVAMAIVSEKVAD